MREFHDVRRLPGAHVAEPGARLGLDVLRIGKLRLALLQFLDLLGKFDPLVVLRGQLAGSLPDGSTAANLVVAYEPVWAIGTGLTPTAKDVEQIHGFIRELLTSRFKADGARMRILYGGSVKPSNAAELMAVTNVNGALVGGASLKAADFLAIAKGCPN